MTLHPRCLASSLAGIFSLGQSGFIGAAAAPPGFALDAHYADLSPIYQAFEYKPQPLLLRSEVR